MSQEEVSEDLDELSPEELKRRIKDIEDPIRYVIYSQIMQGEESATETIFMKHSFL